MKSPIGFVYGNCVFADSLDDGWAAFAVETESYEWLSEDGKRSRFLALLGALEAIEADVQILRVGRRWDVERYARELEMGVDLVELGPADVAGASLAGVAGAGPYAVHSKDVNARARTHARINDSYLEEHHHRLQDIGTARPEVFLIVSLREPERDVAAYVSRAAERHPREWLRGIRSALSVSDRRVLKVAELERARVRADQAHARLADYLPVRQARGVELQWLVRRAFCRGLGEPQIDGLHEPRALVFERNGEATLAPLEGDVMRWGSLVPFPWFILLALGCAFRPLDAPPLTAPSGAKRPIFGPQNAQNPRSRNSLKSRPRATPLGLPSLDYGGARWEAGWRCKSTKSQLTGLSDNHVTKHPTSHPARW